MLANKRICLSIVPMLIGIIAALISAEFALIGLSSIAITALIIAVSLILMSSLARRKSSSPFE